MVKSIRPDVSKPMVVSALALTAVLMAGCDSKPTPDRCRIDGPRHLMPGGVAVLREGMTVEKVESILNEPAVATPVEGRYYFRTGGDCPLRDGGGIAPCGVVATFDTTDRGGAIPTAALEQCWWGAVEE